MREKQTSRAWRKEQLEREGVIGLIDAVTLQALHLAGISEADVLARLREADGWIIDVTAPDGRRFPLHWDDGTVWCSLSMGGGMTWDKGTLRFQNAPRALDKRVHGRRLVEVVRHP